MGTPRGTVCIPPVERDSPSCAPARADIPEGVLPASACKGARVTWLTFCGLGVGVWGLGFGVWGLWVQILGLRFGIWGVGFEVRGVEFGGWGLGLRVRMQGSGFSVQVLWVDRAEVDKLHDLIVQGACLLGFQVWAP